MAHWPGAGVASVVGVIDHDVPRCRQLIEPAEWVLHGGWALGDRMEWSDRACGMAALRMILLAYGGGQAVHYVAGQSQDLMLGGG
jgi:hypothetical protein